MKLLSPGHAPGSHRIPQLRGPRSSVRWFIAIAAITAPALTVIACSEPVEFAHWTLAVPEGTRIIEYPAVPIQERTERIELVEDLVIGQRGDDPNYIFYGPRGVVADSTGRILVLDSGNHRVQVFDAEGEYVQTLGVQGQGPGELARPMGIFIAGDNVLVRDSGSAKFVIWSSAGEHLGDSRFAQGRGPAEAVGLDNGFLVGRDFVRVPDADEEDFTFVYELAIFSQQAERTLGLQRFPRFEPVSIQRNMPDGGAVTMSLTAPTPSVEFAATRSGDIYASSSAEYQVHAFTVEGEMRWALRQPWERKPLTQDDIDSMFEPLQERIEDADASEAIWPDQFPALANLTVDGRGRLYVFPYFGVENADEWPVDVYSRDGELLFSGWIPRASWQFAHDDFILGTETDEETGDERIIRYRLVWPE